MKLSLLYLLVNALIFIIIAVIGTLSCATAEEINHIVLVKRKVAAVYDLVEHKAVPFEVEGDLVKIKVSLPPADGKVFMVTPQPLAKLKAEYGGDYVRVTSSDVRTMIPICATDEKGNELYGVVRDGLWRRKFGNGRIQITNLADGTVVEAVSNESAASVKTEENNERKNQRNRKQTYSI